MGVRAWGRKYQSTIVCIDSYDNGVPIGFISNPYLREPKPFRGIVQFLKEMEWMLNDMNLPQSFTEIRSFSTPVCSEEPAASPQEAEHTSGKLATFAVSVIFRQNASWQGTVTWVDRGREESFRSVLELIMLMDSALCAEKGGSP